MNTKKFTKKDILNHKVNGTLDELFNKEGGEISGGVPNGMNNITCVDGSESSEEKEHQTMNQQDKLGFIRTNNVLLRRESKFNELFLEEISKLKKEDVNILEPEQMGGSSIEKIESERPEVFLKVDMFKSDINSFELTPEEKNSIVTYLNDSLVGDDDESRDISIAEMRMIVRNKISLIENQYKSNNK